MLLEAGLQLQWRPLVPFVEITSTVSCELFPPIIGALVILLQLPVARAENSEYAMHHTP